MTESLSKPQQFHWVCPTCNLSYTRENLEGIHDIRERHKRIHDIERIKERGL